MDIRKLKYCIIFLIFCIISCSQVKKEQLPNVFIKSITFENGELIINLHDGESRTFYGKIDYIRINNTEFYGDLINQIRKDNQKIIKCEIKDYTSLFSEEEFFLYMEWRGGWIRAKLSSNKNDIQVLENEYYNKSAF